MDTQFSEQILKRLDEQNTLIINELNRQAKEREAQSKKEAEAIENKKTEDTQLKAERAKKEAEESQRYEELVKSMLSIAKNVADETKVLSEKSTDNSELLAQVKTMNKNLTTLVEYQEKGQSYQNNQLSLGTMTVSLLMIGIGAFLLIKFGGFVVSKIIKIIA